MKQPRTWDRRRSAHRSHRALRSALRVGVFSAVIALAASAGSAQQPPQGAAALGTLEQRSGMPLEVSRSPLTGLPTYIGTRPGHAIALPVSSAVPADTRALAFVHM